MPPESLEHPFINLLPINSFKESLFVPASTLASWQQVAEIYVLCREAPFQVNGPQFLYWRIWVNYFVAEFGWTVVLHSAYLQIFALYITQICPPAFLFQLSSPTFSVSVRHRWILNKTHISTKAYVIWTVTLPTVKTYCYILAKVPTLCQLSVCKRNFFQVSWQLGWLFVGVQMGYILWFPFIHLLICAITQQISKAGVPEWVDAYSRTQRSSPLLYTSSSSQGWKSHLSVCTLHDHWY